MGDYKLMQPGMLLQTSIFHNPKAGIYIPVKYHWLMFAVDTDDWPAYTPMT